MNCNKACTLPALCREEPLSGAHVNAYRTCLANLRNSRTRASLFLAATLFMMGAPKGATAQVSATIGSRTMTHTPAQVLDGRARLTQTYDPSKKLRLTIGLASQHPDQQRELLDQLHDKKSSLFHKFLTADEWNARFAPSVEDEQAVVDWAQSQGLTITHRYKSRLLVDVEAPVATIEKALNLTINNYQMNGQTYFGNDRDPQIPSALTNVVQSIMGMNSFIQLRPAVAGSKGTLPPRPDYVPGPAVGDLQPMFHAEGNKDKLAAAMKVSADKKARAKANTTGGPQITNGYYDPTDVYSSQAYNLNGLDSLGHCCNPTGDADSPPEASIAIASYGDVNGSDLTGFHNLYPYLAEEPYKVSIDGGYSCVGYDDNCLEVTMDTEWSEAWANSFGSEHNTARVYVYEAASFGDMADLYTAMMEQGYARVTSTSWGCEEACFGDGTATLDGIWSSMVAQGWTLIASAGDNGATGGCGDGDALIFPGSDPNFISAGGNDLSLDSNSNFVSEGAWQGATWSGACHNNYGGGTGGYSSYFATPSYQSGMGFGSRSVPDIALNAIEFQNFYFYGGMTANAGTSIVAPELAGFFAQQNAYGLAMGNACGAGGTSACAPIGNANYYIYDEGKYATAAHYPFYDITSGCNNNDITAAYGLGYYCAGNGFDQVTGWGSANMLQLAWAINWYHAAATGAPTVNFSGPATNTWYNSNQIVGWTVTDSVTNNVPGTGIAGFTQGWDSIPNDSYFAARPATGDSFFAGPQFPNGTGGCLALGASGCAGGVSQGCHTAYVRAWNNMGITSGAQAYGPLCYDTIAPTVAAAFSGTKSGSIYVSPVRVTLSATDGGSGVRSIDYQLDGGAVTAYSSPLTISQGSHTLTYYSVDVAGNDSNIGSASFSIQSPTTTKLGTSTTSTLYGDNVALTATVGDTFGVSPSGSVQFKHGSTVVGTAALSGGKAVLNISTLPVGSNSITASYPGNAYDEASSSSAVLVAIKQATTSTSVTSSKNPLPFDEPVTFTATVKPTSTATPTGSVTFKNGSATLATVGLSSGKATYTTSSLTVGSHAITAVYAGNTDYAASTSSTLTEKVSAQTTSTTLSTSLNPAPYNKAVSFTAMVKASATGTPTGSVTFKNGSTIMATVNLSSGKAVYTTSTLPVGGHTITAVYNGNADYSTSNHGLSETIEKAMTVSKLASSATTSTFDKSVTFTAEVTSTSTGTLTGTVTFKNGGSTLGTVSLSGGKAVYTTTALPVGTHSITASYSGSADFNTSTSSALTETVKQATTTTTLASSKNPSTSGQAVTFTALVKPSAGTIAGTVSFYDGSTKIGTETLSGGKATFTTNGLAAGTHSIKAIYANSTDFATSTSAALSQKVNP